MQCLGCGLDVHPVQEMLAGEAGNMRGFSNRCPTIGCNTALPLEEPITIQADSSAEIAVLEAELHALEGDEDTEERAQAMARVKARLHRLRNPRPCAPAPVVSKIIKADIQQPKTQPAVASAPLALSLGGTDIVTLLRSELERIEIQAQKIRAMLAAADAVS